jgi:hypothetical protein
LFVKAEGSFKLAARVRALSAFKQSDWIGRVVTECFFCLRTGGRSATRNKQQDAARRQEEFVPA